MEDGALIVQFCITTKEDANSGWTQVVMFSKIAERAASILRSGSHITLEGILKLSPWTDNNNIQYFSRRIIAIRLEIHDSIP